jgi:hypothetical protein
VVAEITSSRRGLQRLVVAFGDGRHRDAYVLTQLIGEVAVGDRVVVNTTAVELGLGTGGWDVVHWNLAHDDLDLPGNGHILKLRYTSLQADVGAAEEDEGHDTPPSLGGLPVVVCGLHSQLAPIAVAFRHAAPEARLAYVMTEAAALPLALSDLVADLVDRGLLAGTITAGQAFGGDCEAVNVRSALDLAITRIRADAVVVGPGPGGVGTGTRHGFSALEVASVLDMATAGGARAITALRASAFDPRPRHRGLSDHSVVALEHAHAAARLAVPRGTVLPKLPERHTIVEVDVSNVATQLTDAGVSVKSMGRGPADDLPFFTFAAAAGVAAAQMVGS